ncbi:Kinesin motor domain-containing protein [Mycena indigotica]|uniref:Kinesin motor domain-containing protein n=1 Tax=Mycena indigotica TaxID=2126181 RepID=A0A8H6S8Q1_9AGAR|nr:Kinesin motor domain-containing protein [Mycena indigotica]KAF7294898.1 Kinesin motor domain-containing protein [Mycena indigotica]
MASRRPPSRAKAPPPAPRSRSALGRPVDDNETNIQVVVRCRRRSELEISNNSPIIVSSNGAKSTEISIETAVPASSLGVVSLPPVRTYPFDVVFGPEADQALIYHEVVAPMLEEVVMGYNCTLFAYGQTGTGKTYTMQGDLNPTPLGNPSAHAGMIPRVLFRLFHTLESSVADYSVKISFIELYNEELRDLLAPDLAPPSTHVQPMGHSGQRAQEGLKIFDDASKHGVVIQGLEEIPVKDSADALALLTKGSERRQSASTNINNHSSRSHSVFSITVHTKESSHAGEDLLKIGKLNLVDLAGSENIGRSGAENKRAREAGMINQSLLTLGRVINALVDKAQHVPYRESKLTRLLQDSLGGTTKTCILATVSPARSNIEETLSTLDYALRAKSIRNKPELNQRMTRNSLLKEYVAEIERLKADVLAAREKNGIFFSEESWTQLSNEHELRQTELEEAKKQVEIVEGQMRNVREEFEQSIGLLKKREGELNETREQLKEAEQALENKNEELNRALLALEQESIVRQAHAETEERLNDVAVGLRGVVRETIKDVDSLHSKLSRTSSTLRANTQVVLAQGKSISSSTIALSRKLDEFVKSSAATTSKLRTEAKEFEAKELETLAGFTERVNEQLKRVQAALAVVQAKDTAEADALAIVKQVVKDTYEAFKVGFGAWSLSLKQTCETASAAAESTGTTAFDSAEAAVKTLATLVETLAQEAQSFVESEHTTVVQVKLLAANAATAEVERLKAQNEVLTQLLANEKLKGEKAKDELLQRVSGLLGEFVQDRDRSLREAVGVVQAGNVESTKAMQAFKQQHAELTATMDASGKQTTASLTRASKDAKRTRDGTLKSLAESKSEFGVQLSSMQTSISASVDSYSSEIQSQVKTMDASSSAAFDRQTHAKRARIEATNSLGVEIQSEFKSVQRAFASTSRNIEGAVAHMASDSNTLSNATEIYQKASNSELSSLKEATKLLGEQGTKADAPTGHTPKKRTWQYVDKWELTKSRAELLKSRGPVDEEEEQLEEQMAVDESPPNSPIAVSLASSTSSTMMPPPQIPVLKKTKPVVVPLVDARNVYTTRRRGR